MIKSQVKTAMKKVIVAVNVGDKDNKNNKPRKCRRR